MLLLFQHLNTDLQIKNQMRTTGNAFMGNKLERLSMRSLLTSNNTNVMPEKQ